MFLLNIIVGSTNRTKVNAIKHVFSHGIVKSIVASSGVSDQPFSDEETRKGAINRAKQSAVSMPNAIGIGLEGGVMYIKGGLYLCNWGALVTEDKEVFTASGARIPLPSQLAEQLKDGEELGDIIDYYAQRKAVRNNEGAIGIFTNGFVSREELFRHIAELLRGQWEYWKLKRSD